MGQGHGCRCRDGRPLRAPPPISQVSLSLPISTFHGRITLGQHVASIVKLQSLAHFLSTMAMFGPLPSHFIRRAGPHGGVGEEPRRGGRRERRGQRYEPPWATGRQGMLHAMTRPGRELVRAAGGRDAEDMRVRSAIVQHLTCSLMHAATIALATHETAAPQPQPTPVSAVLNVREVMWESGLKLRRVGWRWQRRRGL